MLHEILLSLSGFSSPFLRQVKHSADNDVDEPALGVLSPPEKALLVNLAHLSELHTRLKEGTRTITASHPSVICRAVSTAISSEHLGQFRKKILEVENSILTKDAAYVGGYGIVPLSAMVGEFAPWTRRLEWLSKTSDFMSHRESIPGDEANTCNGATIINFLRTESHTGYQDLEEAVLSLISTAESAWVRQLSGWLLHGSLPQFGQADFMVQVDTPADKREEHAAYSLRQNLVPEFVDSQTARSILFIGRSLTQLRAQGIGLDAAEELLPSHVNLLRRLINGAPLRSFDLTEIVHSLRTSISRNILSRLLPLSKVRDMLDIFQDFFLLRKGEFSRALICSADQRLRDRGGRGNGAQAVRKAGKLEGIIIKDAELVTALNEAWAEMEALQNEDDPVDEELERARDLLTLTTASPYKSIAQEAEEDHCLHNCLPSLYLFHDVLFPNPSYLGFIIQSPLDLFINDPDVATYSLINAFLLSIRRAEMQLNNLWRQTLLRRFHPSPHGPPFSSTEIGKSSLLERRKRENGRSLRMRKHWATVRSATYVLSELSAYFQGEVIEGSWKHFRSWLTQLDGTPDAEGNSRLDADISCHSDVDNDSRVSFDTDGEITSNKVQPDPETLTNAHRLYLSSLTSSLLLSSKDFCKAVRGAVASVQHYTALMSRLQRVQKSLDLEEDEGVLDALADHRGEEKKILVEMDQSRGELEEGLKEIFISLQMLEEDGLSELSGGIDGMQMEAYSYTPRRNAGLDRLLIKLDFLRPEGRAVENEVDSP
ncbi:MAG: hypothetical protein Q9160_003030 [Pyrenula sp. 1 TL-2023]